MKKRTTALGLLVLITFASVPGTSLLFAQTTGEYRSNSPVATGPWNWSNPAAWQTWNGTAWVAATVAPTGNEPKITIQSTDSIYAGAVTITDTLVNQGELVADTNSAGQSVLAFGSGGVYQHAENGGSIPSATWNTGSTCLVTGATSSAPSNANQNFYNFAWDCAGQTTGLNVAWNGNTIGGNLVVSVPSSQQFRMSNNNANGGNPITIKILGNIVVNSGKLTPTGSGSAQTYTIIDSGNIYVNSGVLYVSGGSGGVVTWYCYGDTFSTADGTSLQTSNSSSKWIFARSVSHAFTTTGTVKYTGGMTFEVDTNATLDLGTSVIAGSSAKFVLDSAANLVTAQAGGLNGNLTNAGGNTFSPYANYVFNGTAAQVTGALLPAEVNGLTVNNPAGLTLSGSVSVADTLNLVSGQLILDTNHVMATTLVGGSSANYLVTDSTGSYLGIPNVGTTKVLFPVGTTAEGYSPVWVTNTGTADTFSVSAMADSSVPAGVGRVNVKWNVLESHPGDAVSTLAFGWMAAAENPAFASDPSAYAQIYSLSPYYKQVGLGAYSSQFTTEPYTLSRIGIATLGEFGVGKFVLNVTPQIGDFGSVQSGPWSSLSVWKQWDGKGWNTTPVAVPDGEVNVFINRGDTVTVDAVDSVGGSLLVDGYLKDVAGLKASGANVVFDSASVYELAHNGGGVAGIPTATWKTGSTCLITGEAGKISSTTGFNANQDFYNLVIDAAFSSNKDLAMYDNTINGNLAVNNTGSARVYLTSPGAGTPNTITIKGSILLTAGQFASNGSGSPADITVNSYGNITATGGNFSLSRGSGPIVLWNFYADSLTLSNATTQVSGTNDVLVFKKPLGPSGKPQSGYQYLTFQNVSYSGGGLPIEVDTGATLVMDTSSIGGSGNFTADSGSTIMTGNFLGLNGSITTSGTVTLNPGASFVFNGTVHQITGSMLPGAVKNLTVDNSKDVSLSKSTDVTGTLTMTNGNLVLDTNNVVAAAVSGGSPTSYVATDSTGNLTVPSVGATQVVFPVGTDYGYAPAWVTLPTGSDRISVSVKPDSTATTNGMGRVNVRWQIQKTNYTIPFTLQLGWMASEEDSVFAENRPAYSQIYLVSSDTVVEQGTGNYTTQSTTQPYTVSRSGITAEFGTGPQGVPAFGTNFVVGHFTLTGIDGPAQVPVEFKLYQNYPNPFNPTTRIQFTVAKTGMASLEVYNVLGQRVATLFSGNALPGHLYAVDFNGSAYASGVYFSVLQSSSERQVKKIVLMK